MIKSLAMVAMVVALLALPAWATWTYTEDFTHSDWYRGAGKWGGNKMVPPTPGPGWVMTVAPGGAESNGYGLVYPGVPTYSKAELYCGGDGYSSAANLSYTIPSDDRGSVTFSFWDGYSGSAANFRLSDAAGNVARRFWISTRYSGRELQIQADDSTYTTIPFDAGVNANYNNQATATFSWDNVAKTVTFSASNTDGKTGTATSPLNTLFYGNPVGNITQVEWFVTGHNATAGQWNNITFGPDGITFTSIPEPATMLLLVAGGIPLLRRRSR